MNWITNFLPDRSQQVKFGDDASSFCFITRSIIQGSGLGSPLYIAMESDLHPMSNFINLMFKFADDTNLLVPQISDISAKTEILNVKSWAFENQMEINKDKTTELVFRRPILNQALLPDPVCNIEQVLEARLLGVIISGKFAFRAHNKYLLSVCSQWLYLLKLLRPHGLPQHELNIVYSAIIVNRLTNAMPARAGFMTADLTSKLNSLLKKCYQYGYSKQCNKISQLIEHADDKLFASLNKPEHCAHNFLPPIKPPVRSLRSRGHKYTLLTCKYSQYINSFVCRVLYRKASTKPKQNVFAN